MNLKPFSFFPSHHGLCARLLKVRKRFTKSPSPERIYKSRGGGKGVRRRRKWPDPTHFLKVIETEAVCIRNPDGRMGQPLCPNEGHNPSPSAPLQPPSTPGENQQTTVAYSPPSTVHGNDPDIQPLSMWGRPVLQSPGPLSGAVFKTPPWVCGRATPTSRKTTPYLGITGGFSDTHVGSLGRVRWGP